MNDRRRGAALVGAAAALTASGLMLTRQDTVSGGGGDFWLGTVMGVAIGMLIVALVLIRRGSACVSGDADAWRGGAPW
jgi:hypothetical protein